MLLLRIVAPSESAATVLSYLESIDVFELIHFPGASRRPQGDLIQCVVSSDLASIVVVALRELGVSERGSITIDRLEARVSRTNDACSDPDPGVVVWEEVEAKTAAMATMSTAYLLYLMAATVIAAIGILTDSVVLIIGAMVVGPEIGPLSGLSVGLIRRRRELVRQSLISLGVGFPLAFVAAFLATWAFRATGVAPETLDAGMHPATMFISRPDTYTVVVAALCGVVGMLSLTTASAGTLIGVLISVTTIPAAGNVGVAAAYGNYEEMWGALLQLGVNLAVIQITGLITLRIQRAVFATRVSRFVDRLRKLRLPLLGPR